jgi:trehalose/maltose hydrolase-like predicted phosphorylase
MIAPEMMEHVLAPTADPNWAFLEDGYDSLRESSVESRFAISNGFLGVRGARSTTRGGRWVIPARTYVAGLFDTSGPDHATRGLIPAADWLGIHILLPGGPLLHHPGDMSSHRMTLDMRRGALLSEGRHLRAPDLGLHVQTSRLVSLSDRAIGLQLIRMEIEDGELDMAQRTSATRSRAAAMAVT